MSMSATTTTRPAQTREGWLTAAAEELWPRIIAAGGTRPETCRYSCGWPSKSALMRASSTTRRIGEAWHAGSDDEAREIFISPALAKPYDVLDVLAHEMVHAALKGDAGHGPAFQRVCKGAGLEKKNGKWTQAGAGDRLAEELKALAETLGTYPHAKLDAQPKPGKSGRMVKGFCADCGVILYGSRNAWDQGLPQCGACGGDFVIDTSDDSAARKIDYTGPATFGVELAREESTITYTAHEGRFVVRITRRPKRNGQVEESVWVEDREAIAETRLVGDVEVTEYTPRATMRRNRPDALSFIAALIDGDAAWSAIEVEDEPEDEDETFDELDDLDLGPIGDWTDEEGAFLADHEDETPDYDDGHFDGDPEAEAVFVAESEKRDASGERKSRAIIDAGGEGAMD
jgi:hypothetical protein